MMVFVPFYEAYMYILECGLCMKKHFTIKFNIISLSIPIILFMYNNQNLITIKVTG